MNMSTIGLLLFAIIGLALSYAANRSKSTSDISGSLFRAFAVFAVLSGIAALGDIFSFNNVIIANGRAWFIGTRTIITGVLTSLAAMLTLVLLVSTLMDASLKWKEKIGLWLVLSILAATVILISCGIFSRTWATPGLVFNALRAFAFPFNGLFLGLILLPILLIVFSDEEIVFSDEKDSNEHRWKERAKFFIPLWFIFSWTINIAVSAMVFPGSLAASVRSWRSGNEYLERVISHSMANGQWSMDAIELAQPVITAFEAHGVKLRSGWSACIEEKAKQQKDARSLIRLVEITDNWRAVANKASKLDSSNVIILMNFLLEKTIAEPDHDIQNAMLRSCIRGVHYVTDPQSKQQLLRGVLEYELSSTTLSYLFVSAVADPQLPEISAQAMQAYLTLELKETSHSVYRDRDITRMLNALQQATNIEAEEWIDRLLINTEKWNDFEFLIAAAEATMEFGKYNKFHSLFKRALQRADYGYMRNRMSRCIELAMNAPQYQHHQLIGNIVETINNSRYFGQKLSEHRFNAINRHRARYADYMEEFDKIQEQLKILMENEV